METIAGNAGDRTHLCEILALSPHRPYTLLTHWTIHTDLAHAQGIIVQWSALAGIVEWRLRTKWFALCCAATTLAVASIILIAMSAGLTSGEAGKGLSIIGWMVILPEAALLLNRFTSSRIKCWTGVQLTCIAAMLAAAIKANGMWPFDVGMLGHIGGTIAGLFVTVIARRAGKYQPRARAAAEEYAVILMLVFLVLVTLVEASELSGLDL